MATYSDKTFDTQRYNESRPSYPDALYETVINYHKGAKDLGIDVGCGSGFVAFKLTEYFDKVVGTDISPVMIDQCNSTAAKYNNISFKVCPGEQLAFEDESVDLIGSAEALHWVDTTKFFAEAFRILKPNGTLAYWFYKEPIWIDYPEANDLYDEFCYGPNHLGPYWEQPGKNRLRTMLKNECPSDYGFVDVIRKEYDPDPAVKDFKQPTSLHIARTIDVEGMRTYLLSWSAYHSWKSKNGSQPDIVDEFIKDLTKIVGDKKFIVEWGTVYTLARKPKK